MYSKQLKNLCQICLFLLLSFFLHYLCFFCMSYLNDARSAEEEFHCNRLCSDNKLLSFQCTEFCLFESKPLRFSSSVQVPRLEHHVLCVTGSIFLLIYSTKLSVQVRNRPAKEKRRRYLQQKKKKKKSKNVFFIFYIIKYLFTTGSVFFVYKFRFLFFLFFFKINTSEQWVHTFLPWYSQIWQKKNSTNDKNLCKSTINLSLPIIKCILKRQ